MSDMDIKANVDALFYNQADRVEEILETAGKPLTPSAVARKAKLTTDRAKSVLDRMVSERFAVSRGNGAWKKYLAWRDRDYVVARKTIDYRVIYSYPFTWAVDEQGNAYRDYDRPGSTHTDPKGTESDARSLAQSIAQRGGYADVVKVDPTTKRGTWLVHYESLDV